MQKFKLCNKKNCSVLKSVAKYDLKQYFYQNFVFVFIIRLHLTIKLYFLKAKTSQIGKFL